MDAKEGRSITGSPPVITLTDLWKSFLSLAFDHAIIEAPAIDYL